LKKLGVFELVFEDRGFGNFFPTLDISKTDGPFSAKFSWLLGLIFVQNEFQMLLIGTLEGICVYIV